MRRERNRRIFRLGEYRATPPVQRYVIRQPTHATAIVFVRAQADCMSEIIAGDNTILHLPEIGIDVPLDEIYANVGLSGGLTNELPG